MAYALALSSFFCPLLSYNPTSAKNETEKKRCLSCLVRAWSERQRQDSRYLTDGGAQLFFLPIRIPGFINRTPTQRSSSRVLSSSLPRRKALPPHIHQHDVLLLLHLPHLPRGAHPLCQTPPSSSHARVPSSSHARIPSSSHAHADQQFPRPPALPQHRQVRPAMPAPPAGPLLRGPP